MERLKKLFKRKEKTPAKHRVTPDRPSRYSKELEANVQFFSDLKSDTDKGSGFSYYG